MDNVSPSKRSEIMRAIKGHSTKIELDFKRNLQEHGLRFRSNIKRCFGKPDFALKKIKTVIFIDSCFWHGCKLHCRMPQSHVRYWKEKIKRNKDRDKQVAKWYRQHGWRLFRFWEHAIRANPDRQIKKILMALCKTNKGTL